MKEFIIKRVSKKPSLKKPILIEGFPGVGNVARIVVDFLIKKTKAKKYMEIYFYRFPNSAFLTEDHLIKLPKAEVYYSKQKGRDFIFIVGDVQPGEEYASYKFSEAMLDAGEELGAKEIVTLGGISAKTDIPKPNVYGACTEKSYFPSLKKAGVRFDRRGSIIIIGAAGLMLGLGQLRKMKGFALLADTSAEPGHVGTNAAREIITILVKYFILFVSVK